ncbi:MAG: LysM peptidoglycan-binding domain-containing protein [Spirochaetes bacterium]|nr:LysM peptidoglycan-binding domain-containing protein [Spirochaetota bacterium]
MKRFAASLAFCTAIAMSAAAEPPLPAELGVLDPADGETAAPSAATADEPALATRPLRGKGAPAANAPERAHAAEAWYTLEIPWGNPVFERFREAYLTEGGRSWLDAVSKRSDPYADFIRERIRYYDLPDELFFLPFVESEYSPWVASRSGAAGIWQFMKNSIGGYGMRVDDWIDERRDFWKSTDGALRKLRDNHRALGNWNLALAAYNAGLGAVTRVVKKGGSSDFYELCDKGFFKRETTLYVPKFMAIVTTAMYGGRNGLPTPWRSPVRWELVPLSKPVDVTMLSDAAGIGSEILKAGNAELKYNVTPPDGAYSLKVPSEHAAAVRAALGRKDIALMRFYLHKVRSGDTLSALARYYEVTLQMILKYNKGLKPELIRIGQTIVIPALKDKKPYVSAEVASEGGIEFAGSYVVARGDTLWSLSLRFHVQPETLAERNGLTLESILREGMTLKVPKI